jgi:hypothetical protein
LARLFARTTFRFLAHHGNAGAVHLKIENGNAWPQGKGQLQLQSLLELALLANLDIFSDGLGGALHRLGGDRQTSQ